MASSPSTAAVRSITRIANLVNGGGSRTTINSGGAINLLGGTTLELNGALLVNNGTVTGTVNVNYGSLAKGTGAYDVVNVNEGGVYSPGNSPGISTATTVEFQNGSFTSGAPRLVMELGGTMPGTQYDQLHVTGALTLNGTLDVRLVDLGAGAFSPTSGESFDILDWGSLTGTFCTSVQLPTLAGIARLEHEPTLYDRRAERRLCRPRGRLQQQRHGRRGRLHGLARHARLDDRPAGQQRQHRCERRRHRPGRLRDLENRFRQHGRQRRGA